MRMRISQVTLLRSAQRPVFICALRAKILTLHGVSKCQDCVSSSTPEAELVSCHYAYHKVLLPAMDLWETLLPTAGKGIFHEDNTAMIQVIRTGRNPTMKHLHRVHRICVATLHERLGGNGPKDPTQLVTHPPIS